MKTIKNPLPKFTKDFIRCGTVGWCMEIIFTALHSLRCRNMELRGQTSLWMFPIYGCAAFLTPISRLLRHKPFWIRGFIYMSLIFSTEFLTGSLLTRHKLCPWDYGHCRWHIRRLIRLDYAPFWFGAGLIFERILSPSVPHAAFYQPPSSSSVHGTQSKGKFLL